MGHMNAHDKYLICIREELDDLESEAAAVNRLFAICEGETVFSSDEVDRLLERYPSAAQKLKRCASSFYPWGVSVLHPWGEPSRNTFEKYPLHVACRNNAPISVIQALIKVWPGALQTQADNRLPLHEACTCGRSLPTIQFLIEEWPDSIKEVTGDDDHSLPLHLALERIFPSLGLEVIEVSLEIIQFLVKQWPESLQKDRNGNDDALLVALKNGRSDHIIQYLVQQSPDSVKKCDYYGATALHCACNSDRSLALIQLLVEQWPDSVKKCDNKDATALHYACQHSWSLPLIRFLAEQWPEAVKIKKKEYPAGLPLMLALRETNTSVETVAFLVDMWPQSVQEKDPDTNESCLSLALYHRAQDVEILKLLIDQWPDAIQIPCRCGSLPLYLALTRVKSSVNSIVKLFTNGMPPLHFLCKYSRTPWITGQMTAIKHMASRFPDHVMRFYRGMLPFHWVCRSQSPRFVLEWWCEQYPAVVRARTTHTPGFPLHCYLKGTQGSETATNAQPEQSDDSCLSAVQFLVEKHPDALTCPNRRGWLPFQVAALHDAPLDVVFYLICENPLTLQTGSHCCLLSVSEQ